MKRVCVITVDLRKSRMLADREAIQRDILNLIKELNSRFKSDILAEFMMTLGDEFQGVLKSPKKALEVFRYIKKKLPASFYCGVGVGGIDTPLSNKPSEMDGPAFHRSRDALDEAKKKKLDIVVKSGNHELDSLVNILMKLTLYIRGRWSKRQREIIEYIESREGIMEKEVAKHFNVSRQYISKVIKESGWRIVKEAEQLADKYMDKLE